MLELARANCRSNEFFLIKDNLIPFPSKKFDLVFSSFVLFELKTKESIVKYLKEARRVLKSTGIFIGVTGSEEMHSCSRDWLCFKTNYPQNKKLRSGSRVKVFLPNENIEFTDFYWTMKDYEECFEKAQLKIIATHFPLGKNTDPFDWKDEKFHSPYVVFVAKIEKKHSS